VSLPEGWSLATVADVALSMQNGIYRPASVYTNDGTPCLRMYNINDGRIVLRDLKRMRLTASEIDQFGLLPGDILVNRVNSRELVGKAAVILHELGPCVFESKNIRLRVDQRKINPAYVSYRLLQQGSRFFNRNAQQTVGMASINQAQLGAFPIPLAPRTVQDRIVAEIDKQFTRIDAAVDALHRVIRRIVTLRTAIRGLAVAGLLGSSRAFNVDAVPCGWRLATLNELLAHIPNAIVDGPFGSNLKTEHYTSGGPRVIRLQNVGDGEFVDTPAHISAEHFEELRKHEAHGGDLIIALLGNELPRACVVPPDIGPAIVKADCVRLRPNEELVSVGYLNGLRLAGDSTEAVPEGRLGRSAATREAVS
jgi:hypothetical protein